MKVLHFIDNGRMGGAQTLLSNILPLLPSFGIENRVVVLGEDRWLAARLEANRVPVEVLNLPRWKMNVMPDLAKVIRSFHPDVIHAHLFKSVMLATFLKARGTIQTPVVVHDHQGFYPQSWRFYYPFPVRWALEVIYQRMLAQVERVIVLTKEMKERYEQAYHDVHSDKIVLLPNAIIYHKRTTECLNFREKYGLPSDIPLVTMVGRFAKEKRWDLFVKLAYQCREEDIAFVGIGTGKLFSRIKKQINALRLKRVFLLGARQDVDCFLRQSTVCVQTSVRENFSLYVIEAMRWGCPVVAMYNGGTEHIIEHGRTGLLAPFGRVQEMCTLTKRLLSLPEERERLSLLAYQKVLAQYTIQAVLPQWVAFYQNLSPP